LEAALSMNTLESICGLAGWTGLDDAPTYQRLKIQIGLWQGYFAWPFGSIAIPDSPIYGTVFLDYTRLLDTG